MNRIGRSLGWLLALLVGGVAAAHAQTGYPDRPVRIIVPIGPGGSYDLVGRQLADALSKRMGQAFVVENKPGAGTVVGTQAASQSEPDGYTLVVGGLSNMAFNSALYSKLGYDPRKDFVPVALIYKFGYVMVGRKDLPQDKLADIVAAAKANPGSISVATAGVGTGQHLVAAAFMKAAGVKFQEIPYKGSPSAFTDLLAGRIDLFFDSIAAGLPYVQSGQARASRCCHRSATRWRLTCRRCRKPAYPASMSIPGSGYSHRQRRRRRSSQNCAAISVPRCLSSRSVSRRAAERCGICLMTSSTPSSPPNTRAGPN
jgi:tripartite-type tricarboxylate transporter receptor subunit TctC